MNLIPFKYNNKIYYLSFLEENLDKKHIDIFNNQINDLFKICFGHFTDYQTLMKFTENKGVSIVIFNIDLTIIFISSFIKNKITRNIELYNVCKNLNDKNIEISIVLKYIIRDFIAKIDIFKGYSNLVLAVLKNNKYIIPTILCYLNIGFIEVDNIPMSVSLSPYISMTLDLNETVFLTKSDKVNIFMSIMINNFMDKRALSRIYHLLSSKNLSSNRIDILLEIEKYLIKNIS